MYIPYKNGHISHTIKNYVLGKIKRYIPYNPLKLTFLKKEPNFSNGLEIVVWKRFGLGNILQLLNMRAAINSWKILR